MFAFSHFYGQFVLRASILRVMFKYLCAFLRAIADFGVYYFLNFWSIFASIFWNTSSSAEWQGSEFCRFTFALTIVVE